MTPGTRSLGLGEIASRFIRFSNHLKRLRSTYSLACSTRRSSCACHKKASAYIAHREAASATDFPHFQAQVHRSNLSERDQAVRIVAQTRKSIVILRQKSSKRYKRGLGLLISHLYSLSNQLTTNKRNNQEKIGNHSMRCSCVSYSCVRITAL